jgi:hypothetical protein
MDTLEFERRKIPIDDNSIIALKCSKTKKQKIQKDDNLSNKQKNIIDINSIIALKNSEIKKQKVELDIQKLDLSHDDLQKNFRSQLSVYLTLENRIYKYKNTPLFDKNIKLLYPNLNYAYICMDYSDRLLVVNNRNILQTLYFNLFKLKR